MKFDNFNTEDFSLDKVRIIEVYGVSLRSYPDFEDSYIVSADYDGKEMTPEEIEWFEQEYANHVWEYKSELI